MQNLGASEVPPAPTVDLFYSFSPDREFALPLHGALFDPTSNLYIFFRHDACTC